MKSWRKIVAMLGVSLGLGGGFLILDRQAELNPQQDRHTLGTMTEQLGLGRPTKGDGSVHARWVELAGRPDDATDLVVDAPSAERQLVELKLPGFFLENVTVAGRECSRVSVPGLVLRRSAGLPQVPALTTTLAVPAGGKTTIKVVEQTVRRYAVQPVEPSAGHIMRNVDPALVEAEFGSFYSDGGVWPVDVAELSPSFILTGTSGVTVRVNPLRYDADKGQLLVVEHLVLEVVTTGGYTKSLTVAATQPEQDLVNRRVFANWTDQTTASGADKYQRLQAAGRMLVVAHDAFLSDLSTFADWKRCRGIDVAVVSVSSLGGTAAGIAQRVAEMYAEPAGLTWLILAGDKAQVPTNAGLYDGSDSDSRYALTDGNDLYPDLFVSRFSATDRTQLLTQVNRCLRYEMEPQTGDDASWYSQAVGVASDEGTPSDERRAEDLREDLLAYGFSPVGQVYQRTGGTRSDIAEALDKGVSLMNYLGHGSGYGWTSVPFSSGDVADLTNTRAWPWIIDVACSNGDFALDACFAEAWLRAGTPEAPTGAVAMIAASSLAPWTPPTLMQAEAVDLLVQDQATTIGSLYYSGLMRVLDAYSGLEVAQQVLEQNVIFGDCSLQVRTAAPEHFLVQELPGLTTDTTSWQLEADGPAGAVVALTTPGVLHGRGVLDASGRAQLSLSGELLSDGQEVTVTLSGYNMVPYSANITVGETVTGVGDHEDEPAEPAEDSVPAAQVNLLGNYPNPFNPSTTIAFELPRDMRVQLAVYDVRGNLVATLLNENVAAGRREVLWNGRDRSGQSVASGVYLYQLVTPDGNLAGRMLLSK